METRLPSYPRKGWSLLVSLTLHWPSSVTNLSVNHAVASICRLIAIFCLCCFSLRSSSTEFHHRKFYNKKINVLTTIFANGPYHLIIPYSTWVTLTECELLIEGTSCLNLSNCALLLHLFLFVV